MSRRLGKIVLGNVLMTFSYAFLTVPLRIINGGVTSFALILSGIVGLDTAVIADGCTIFFLALCYFCLGRECFLGSLLGAVCYMVSFSLFHSFGICLIENRLVSAVTAGLLVGCGYYLCITQNSTGVSFDTLALLLHRWCRRIPVAGAMFCINLMVLAFGAAVYGVEASALGILFSGVQAVTLDLLLKRSERKMGKA